ncbi:MAG: VOC family protein [Micromonosporaceae bacterium]|nr:VOC family protein [Micromonosporaceae bacterium]
MATGMNTIIYPVKDLAAAKELYAQLFGVQPYQDQPYYVGFRVGDQEFGLDPNGHKQGMTAPVGYWEVADIQQAIGQLEGAGAEVVQKPRDVGGGKLIARVRDADGNVTGLAQTP